MLILTPQSHRTQDFEYLATSNTEKPSEIRLWRAQLSKFKHITDNFIAHGSYFLNHRSNIYYTGRQDYYCTLDRTFQCYIWALITSEYILKPLDHQAICMELIEEDKLVMQISCLFLLLAIGCTIWAIGYVSFYSSCSD